MGGNIVTEFVVRWYYRLYVIEICLCYVFRTVMNLEENGDVLWVASPGAEDLPLISCETYDMFHTSVTGLVIRFGSYQGHIIEFRVSLTEISNYLPIPHYYRGIRD